ncbi:MAG: SPASM domain-containing protein [Phycisphaerales bacterium]|nr:SPASM domain-containing protein [Phycisphaerales bacterium]
MANNINLDGTQSVGLTVHGTGYQRLETGKDIHTINDTPVHSEPGDQNQMDDGWYDRIDEQRLGTFAVRKQHLPPTCFSCEWKPFCHGGCPKHRPMGGDVPEPTILCESYKMFYAHAMPRMQWLAGFLRMGQQPPPPMSVQAAMQAARGGDETGRGVSPQMQANIMGAALEDRPLTRPAVSRNDLCPCGSGLKYKKCHGKNL